MEFVGVRCSDGPSNARIVPFSFHRAGGLAAFSKHCSLFATTMALKCPRSMAKSRRNPLSLPMDDSLPLKQRKPVPHAFVLEALAPLSPYTRPMFGCLAVYVKDKIVLILRDRPTNTSDNGVWLATTRDHHDSLRREFPNMRSIQVLGKPDTGWQVLPADAPDFEAAAQRACDLVRAGDARIGKVPGARMASASKQKTRRNL
jgi:hypothetical protein